MPHVGVDLEKLRALTPDHYILLHVDDGRGQKAYCRLDVRAAAEPDCRWDHALLPVLLLQKWE